MLRQVRCDDEDVAEQPRKGDDAGLTDSGCSPYFQWPLKPAGEAGPWLVPKVSSALKSFRLGHRRCMAALESRGCLGYLRSGTERAR